MKSLLSKSASSPSVDEGYARCANLAKNHYENFTVVSHLLPSDKHNHMYAIYAFCRLADDLGDKHEGDRLGALDKLEEDLLRCYEGSPKNPYIMALQNTIRQFDIPRGPFLKLIEANRIDQRTTHYLTYADLDSYCQYSANPVGHLVLYVFGYRDQERQRLSNYTCTALQLANFWQDVARDFAMGRVYLPLEDMNRFGYFENQLARSEVTDEFRVLMAFEVDRTRTLFRQGLGLVDTLEGRLKLDVSLFSKGGMAVLDAIERHGYDVLSKRPVLSRTAKLRIMATSAIKMKLFGRT